MVDIGDLKSPPRKGVRVRVSFPAGLIPVIPPPIIKEALDALWRCFIKKIILTCLLAAFVTLHTAGAVEVRFHGFSWGTSMDDFIAQMGPPVHVDEVNGFQSLLYDNLIVSGYQAFMVAFFSENGLEGGVYYFLTFSLEELMQCYRDIQSKLLARYGPAQIQDIIFREMRPFESVWHLENGHIFLNVNTRRNEPVTLWYSSPALTRIILGQ